MCLSPDEMTTTELNALIADYDEKELQYKDGWFKNRADQLRAIIAKREEDGTTDVIPETTPRHLNSTVN